MTTNKDFKHLVRARMAKTGESYTSARAKLIAKSASRQDGKAAEPMSAGLQVGRSADQPGPAALPPGRLADLAGMSDAKLKQATGCTWEKWVQALDHAKAHNWPHREIARYVREKFKTPSWWTQTVTVGYERIKGLREKGQQRDGGFEANKSRTFAAPVGKLYRAFNDKRVRSAWLPAVNLTIRSKTREKYMRITMPDQTSVAVGFYSKGAGKSQVAIQHGRFPDKAASERTKAFWGERLKALGEILSPAS